MTECDPIRVEIPKRFKRRLDKKTKFMQASIVECIYRLSTNPRHPGLRTHKVGGTAGVFEAYVDSGNQLTFEYGDNRIVLRNHCNHDMLDRNP